ncbi:hypothetical protein M501DRAFT_927858 [Patellaria atrata CBS 101060]|uniref:Uncharacterized protein n=1 Tax=Patellaria atrata CBS 101060 TaxID=1346257 RepID=A0A9P4VSS3_9PEZI|nr:hypothetical protein M501DRAFT_927858 [Patellaria atrata CBS 101060]
MPSLAKVFQWTCVLGAAVTQAAPASKPVSRRQEQAPMGITDIDILQFALTAEHLESEFYRQGFNLFPKSDFQQLGLSEESIAALQNVGATEAAHVSFLLSGIANAGFMPVSPCEYNFGFTDAAGMVGTARILEAVGVSAYLGAAPLINSSAILGQAATIATVEARHQTFIRVASSSEPVPGAFDTPLGPRAVFTLAAAFITSCPAGSLLNIPPFPSIALSDPTAVSAGARIVLADPAQPSNAAFCVFATNGGYRFETIENGGCIVPQGLVGETYMMLASAKATSDDVILAGPTVIVVS